MDKENLFERYYNTFTKLQLEHIKIPKSFVRAAFELIYLQLGDSEDAWNKRIDTMEYNVSVLNQI